MKTFHCALLLAVLAGANVRASAASPYTFNFNSGFDNGGVVPDGNTTGWSDTRSILGIGDNTIVDVNVFLQINGGYNGDFYAYLVHNSGFSVLLDRVGRTAGNPFGYGNSGLNVLFDDSAANPDIHVYQTVVGFAPLIGNGSSWSPGGRNVNPVSVLDTDSRTRLLDQFNGLNPNGDWTLFVADLSNGEQGAIVNWGLNITAVPEPSSVCLIALGLITWLLQRRKVADSITKPGSA